MRWTVFISVWLSLAAYAQPIQFSGKVASAQRVLEQVGATYGFGILELPKLEVSPRKPGNNRIANLELAQLSGPQSDNNLDRSRILVDEETLDICQAVDPSGSALAFVMAHEMAHFYHKHAIFPNFAEQGERLKNPIARTKSLQQEREADQTGLLFAYLAGYDPGPILGKLFDRIYEAYKLHDPMPGHPSKADRQRETNLRTNEFRTYGYLFALGHALYCREKFAHAARCFEYVYTRYPLKEAYNNFGTCRLQEALRLKKKSPLLYLALPFEVDPRNRLLRIGERGEAQTGDITTLMREADAAFQKAIEIDPRYRSAYLNRAIGELLTDNPYTTLGILNALTKQTRPNVPPNVYLLQAIAHHQLGERTKADALMKQAVARKAYQAGYNWTIYEAVKKGTVGTLRQPWQRLQSETPALTGIGCQAGSAVLEEVDEAPALVRWNPEPLLEMNSPPPYILIELGRAGADTWFRTEFGKKNEGLELIFRLKR